MGLGLCCVKIIGSFESIKKIIKFYGREQHYNI